MPNLSEIEGVSIGKWIIIGIAFVLTSPVWFGILCWRFGEAFADEIVERLM